jgi:uncharacterized protein
MNKTNYFLDSSALVKHYITEKGTQWVTSLVNAVNQNRIVVSNITQVEVISGIMRRHREGTITSAGVYRIRNMLNYHIRRDYEVIVLDSQIIRIAESLLGKYTLKAYDAVQLATALESQTRLIKIGYQQIHFISGDMRLLTSAQAEGLITDNPNNYP